ncbi:Crp/Fnr family transcriptional regulator [Paenibacillus sp. SYP-B3998]|uniref:Crp/Fnr family transcriptional regulator n=1 Tax=Paenibacillus sp. SYP-B3998 TaxID=2678564 RepID=A0A6G3ZV09_9BACL|nr:Crp/Fnr family transcriptional regulator [Paenibacillus sp. SYP-B3998]NEW05878.1 Crp/Fnr family transcriptional regulator [Paenibacillus sp. SYP-B3998]
MSTINSSNVCNVRNTECFSADNLVKLQQIMYETKVASGSHLFWEGDTTDKLYFIKSGRVKITKSSDEGRQFILYMYQEGDMFGQVDPFRKSFHVFNAEIIEDSVVGVILQKDLEVLLWQNGDLAVEFMKWMGLIHRMTQTKFRDLMMFGKHGALCSLLIRLANTYGIEQVNHICISKVHTNTELADMIGATRESVNRMLSELRKANAIKIENGHIIVEDLQYLRDICHCENCPKDICRM